MKLSTIDCLKIASESFMNELDIDFLIFKYHSSQKVKNEFNNILRKHGFNIYIKDFWDPSHYDNYKYIKTFECIFTLFRYKFSNLFNECKMISIINNDKIIKILYFIKKLEIE